MYKPSVEQLKKAMFSKGYPIKTGEWEFNIIGIRNDNSVPNSFDDTICILFKDHYGDEVVVSFSCTTDAGLFWLKYPMNVKGTAILKEGHYPNVFKIGKHLGYKALEQIGKMRYVRDNDKDNELDFNALVETYENAKTNIHHAAINDQSVLVDKWSAGCQVINVGWNEFLELCEKSVLITERNIFSYTLLNINDVKYQ